ncbi:retinol dehydrogenase 14 [Trichuris trichiura]|uniref:Retinol dehydrogenase 14 n=1 Tax=Trichuris trichiura TaxID=36087 RepID=A0A077Z1N1_TRITR|nr:retinol dehydrogenase 14 [Trichuris trichiura]
MLFHVKTLSFRNIFKGKQYTGSEKAKGKVFVVTGANCGIGKQIARELNYRGAKVYMGCRSMTKADKAVTELVASGCSADRLIVLPLDLSSFESIDNFVNALKERETKLDGLVNNAGIMFYPKFQLTNDGHETTWQVNYLSNVALCEKLLPLLEACEGEARIVFVSSRSHHWAGSLNVDKIDSRSHWDRFATYGKSKVAQIMYSKLLAEKLRVSGSSVTSNSCHPGVCNTRITRYAPLVNTKLVQAITAPFAWFFLKTPKDGAQTPLYLLLSKEVSGVSGKYFVNMKQRDPSDLAMDMEQCRQLYVYSKAACNLD